MADSLRLADDLTLPLDAVTQAIAILAKRRAGKSYTAAKLVEQIFAAGEQVVIVDPKGDWWGLRSSADGQRPGLPILILGGEHGDLPLEPGAGEVVARLVVEERVSVLLDLSRLRRIPLAKGETPELVRFMGPFLDALYRLKAQERYRTSLLLVIDEADVIAPQQARYEGQGLVLAAADEIVRRGGQRGLGCVLVSQRSAVINKDLLSQIEVLITLRTVAPQDLDALAAWLRAHGTASERAGLLDSLPSLPVGTAWVWSPGWPTAAGLFRRIVVAPRETFDSGATPSPGQHRAAPRTLADVDVTALRAAMAGTIARAEADDPAALRARVADLERRLRERPAPPAPERVVERVEVPVVPPHLLARLEEVERSLGRWLPHIRATGDEMARLHDELRDCRAGLAAGGEVPIPPPARPAPVPAPRPVPAAPPPPRAVVPPEGGRVALAGGERKILTVLAQYPQGRTRVQAAILAGYSSNGGGYGNLLGALRSKGLLVGSDPLRITDAGRAALGDWEPLPTGRALLDHWLARLPGMQRNILAALAEAYPNGFDRDGLGRATGYAPAGGAFGNALGRLRTLELVEGSQVLRASATFFDQG